MYVGGSLHSLQRLSVTPEAHPE